MDVHRTQLSLPDARGAGNEYRGIIQATLPDSLEGFRDFHQGESIVVCGCGKSLAEFADHEEFVTVGVNDVGRLFQPTYLVVLNPRSQFSGDRFDHVVRSRAQALFTQLDLGIDHPRIVRFNLGQQNGVSLDSPNALPYTRNSPYVAMCLAALMGAKRIGLIGVDFTDDHFFGRTGRHPLAGQFSAIDQQYRRLEEALRARGVAVVNLSSESRLTAFRKDDIAFLRGREPAEKWRRHDGPANRAVKALKIVSYATTPVAGVPPILARCISTATPHEARCVWARNDYGNGVVFDGDVEWTRLPREAERLIGEADLVIVHNGKVDPAHRSLLAQKPVVTVAHNYRWNVDGSFVDAGFPGLVVGQYQATLQEFAGWSPVPNPVPLWETAYQPEAKPDVVTVAYTPSGRHESYAVEHKLYWHGKGYETTTRVLRALAARHAIRLQIIDGAQVSHAAALAMKRNAHIVIDECVTGSYHRSSLEGLATGCVVVNGLGLRPPIEDVLQTCAGGASSPFVFARLETLERELERLVGLGPAVLAQRGAAARQWMERHWQFATQWDRHWKPAADAAMARVDGRSIARPAAVASTIVDTVAVTVVIPHGGRERLDLLATTLKIAMGSRLVAEVIVAEMDDAPHAQDLVQRLGARYVFIRAGDGFNKARAINVATALARNELVLWLDGDLLLPDRFVDRAVSELRERELDCLIPWASVRYLDADDSRAVMAGTRRADECRPVNTYYTRRGGCGGAVLVRRHLVRQFGGVAEEFRGWGGEDNAWFHKARVVGRAAITNRDDQHLHHLFHPLSGGYGAGEHIAANPNYQTNLALLHTIRRVTDRSRFLASYPPPALTPCPWDRSRKILLAADQGDAWACDRLQRAREFLSGLYQINADVRPPDGDLEADVVVIFGMEAADRDALDASLRPRLIVVDRDDTMSSSTVPAHVRGDAVDFPEALIAPLSVVLGADAAKSAPAIMRKGRASALVAAASGIGDIIRVTPLIRVLTRLGHRVDFLIAADYPDSGELFRGAREINRIIVHPALTRRAETAQIAELADTEYEVAVFTHLAAALAPKVMSQRPYVFDRDRWLADGDRGCSEHIASELGWRQDMPLPFVVPSSRRFDLPDGTVVIHPGCKRNWPWKRWHGFADLAARFENIAVVGTEEDRNNVGTYFGGRQTWPAHVQDYTGKLSLPDTAALIAQSAALVSNDSGLMHLGVAVGTPTFGIFGITNPHRETVPAPHMHVITKGLRCEPACRTQPQGRRDCEHHLDCLKTLTASEVAARIEAARPGLAGGSDRAKAAEERTIRLNYYAGVFDASGYGQAARLYVRALSAAGIKVSVVHTGARPPQVEDAEVEALLGDDPAADFHLFHGIPPWWAGSAYRHRNVIAMTVWETDTMPQQWRNPLGHAIDVWLPCSFNVEVFQQALRRKTFRLPHAAPDIRLNESGAAANDLLNLATDDFVYYSIFEWQDRKNPEGIIEAFLRSFPEENDAVLVLKSSAASASVAAAMLEQTRTRIGSRGRVMLRCESWNEETLSALHARGDCYVSLHKGEGWGYPLFEAACRGTPVIATAYAGPLDYLDAEHHWLVRCVRSPVRQRYAFYHSSMRWAEPDLAHAAEGMAWVYKHREAARARALAAAHGLRASFSFEQIGAMAKARLIDLLQTSTHQEPAALRPQSLPIPGDWYDADYFENGRKSNWDRGYTWPMFSGIFEDVATYLTEVFPEARSFLDAGCAKGFLVKTLRQRGLDAWGFDHSPWAISKVEPEAKPFIRLADLAVDYNRQFDVLVAMSLLETLTEEQLKAFLGRARTWIQQAVFATIPTLAPGTSGPIPGDRDLSHITLRDREWWLRQFVDAGWRQDPIHRAFERICQTQSLPTRMSWDVYVFSPR
ncbi:glycosyltransferase family 9 protein [Bradyrhizobium diazoefficiens]|uniref:glycosyltransferase family 9 protein n=1 Tax=Bradyrhizobium diazoefficiens TaxID=1355477 RepID=UPI00346A2BFA